MHKHEKSKSTLLTEAAALLYKSTSSGSMGDTKAPALCLSTMQYDNLLLQSHSVNYRPKKLAPF